LLVIASLIKKNGFLNYGYKVMGWFIGGSAVLLASVWLGNEGFNLSLNILEKSKGGGLMGNSSLTATVLLFSFFFSVFLLTVKEIGKKYKIFLSLFLVLTIFSPLFVSLFGVISARGALLGIGAGGIFFIFSYLALSKKKIARIAGLSFILLSLLASIFVWQKVMTPETSLNEKFKESLGENRLIFWDISKKTLKENPLFGFGPENYRVAQQTFIDPHIYEGSNSIEVWSDRAHNIIFDTGVSGGYPAIIFYITFLLIILYGIYVAFREEKITRTQAGILASLVVAYFFQNLFVFDSLVSLISLMILAGIVFGFNTKENQKSKNNPSSKQVIALLIIIATIPVWIFFTYMPIKKAVAFSDVISLSLNKRPERYADLLKGSVVGNSYEVGSIAEDTYYVYSDNQKSLKSDPKTLPYALKDLEKFTEYLEAVAKEQPRDLRLHLNLARLLNIYMYLSDKMTDKDLVERTLKIENTTMEISPNDPQVYWTKAFTLFRSGDVEGAKETAQKAIEIAPYIDFSHELLESFSK
jgi:hypothetical protein